MQPWSDLNWNRHSEYKVACQKKDNLSLGGACLEENIDYAGANVNTVHTWKADLEGCRTFCRTNHPEAPFFSWVSKNYATTNYHSRCFCKSGDQGRKSSTGITSGMVNCTGKRYYHCYQGSTTKNIFYSKLLLIRKLDSIYRKIHHLHIQSENHFGTVL